MSAVLYGSGQGVFRDRFEGGKGRVQTRVCRLTVSKPHVPPTIHPFTHSLTQGGTRMGIVYKPATNTHYVCVFVGHLAFYRTGFSDWLLMGAGPTFCVPATSTVVNSALWGGWGGGGGSRPPPGVMCTVTASFPAGHDWTPVTRMSGHKAGGQTHFTLEIA